MINLLSPNDQRQLVASRTNTLILRYILLLSLVIAIMALEILGVYLLLNNDMKSSQDTISANDEKARAYQSVSEQATTFRTNLAISKYVLNKQVPYTSLIFAIAQSLPSNAGQQATLDNLSIVPSTFGTPTILTIRTNSTETAIAVKTNLQKVSYNNKRIFSAVSFESITAPSTNSSTTTYQATYRVTYAKDITTQ